MARKMLPEPGIQHTMEGMRSDYAAAKVSRFRRRRTNLLLTGSGADYHYRNVFDYLRIIEYARDMERNDAIVGQMIGTAVNNTIQGGLTPDPKTGDEKLDTDILERFEAWASDPRQCDIAGTHTFTDIEELVLRSALRDGDIFALPTDEGPLQIAEAHRLRTPTGTKRNVICGVLIDTKRRPQEYWITRDDIDPWVPVTLVGDVEKVPARDDEGNPNVIHVFDPKRYTQTRGISALAPVFDFCGMHEDLQFSKLVQQQVASCVAIIRERNADFKYGRVTPYGPQSTEQWDAFQRIVEDLAPGMEIRGVPGEKITGFSPNIPNAEFFQQMRMILQIIGVNLGIPLVMLLMDASDTNFSGWRGAMDEARRGFRRNQRWMIDHFHTPVYQWKLRQFIRDDRVMRSAAARLGAKFYCHAWNAPRWPYIQPLQDAQADQLRQRAVLTSPSRLHNERGQNWTEIHTETSDDNAAAILYAAKKAKEISGAIGEPVTWREVLFLTDPELSRPASAPQEPKAKESPKTEPLTEKRDKNGKTVDVEDEE